MPVSPIANVANSNAESAAICAVIVVPMFAPMVMVVACVRVMTPALTRPTTITVVSEELWITAVTAVPMPTPTRLEDHSFVLARNFSLRVAPSGRVTLPEARWKSERILPVASFSMLSESSLTPGFPFHLDLSLTWNMSFSCHKVVKKADGASLIFANTPRFDSQTTRVVLI